MPISVKATLKKRQRKRLLGKYGARSSNSHAQKGNSQTRHAWATPSKIHIITPRLQRHAYIATIRYTHWLCICIARSLPSGEVQYTVRMRWCFPIGDHAAGRWDSSSEWFSQTALVKFFVLIWCWWMIRRGGNSFIWDCLGVEVLNSPRRPKKVSDSPSDLTLLHLWRLYPSYHDIFW